MSAQDFELPIYYIHQIAELLNSMGVDTHGWLVKNHLQEKHLNDLALVIPFTTFKQLIIDALALTQEPALGLLVGERLLVNTHGILGYAAMNSSTLRQAVELFQRFIRLRTPLVSARYEIQGKSLHVVFEEPYPLREIRRPVLEAVILAVKNVLDYIAVGARHVSYVAFPFDAPDYSTLSEELFQCDLKYCQGWAGFAVPVEVIDLPLKMTDRNTFREAELICQRELEKISRNENLSTRVRCLMLEKRNGFPSLNVTARLFNLTPRTLHRYLLAEGTSYKAILEEVRHNLAMEHLKGGNLSIQEIAYALGYTDIANFRRAFKRWEGVAPSEYRGR